MRIRKRSYGIFLLLLVFGWQVSVNAQAVKSLVTTSNIPYAWDLLDWENKPNDTLKFDIYYPPGANTGEKKYPMILSLHAGSFTGGSKEGQVSGADALNDLGFVVVSPDYRVGYNDDLDSCRDDTLGQNYATYRATQDGNACMRYLYHYADSLHIDTGNFFLMGNSAGADLALHMQFITDEIAKFKLKYIYDSLGSVQSTGNSFPYSYKVKAVCAMWGALPNYGLVNKFTALPMILFKGGQDPGLPPDSAPNFGIGNYKKCANYAELFAGVAIYQAEKSLGVPCVYHYQPKGFHAAYDEEFCTKATSSFFKALMNGTPYSGQYLYYQQSW